MREEPSVDMRNDCCDLCLLSRFEFWQASLWERKEMFLWMWDKEKILPSWPLKTWHEQNVFSFHMHGVQLFRSLLCFCFAFIFPVWIVGGNRNISANASPTQLLKWVPLWKTDFFFFFKPNKPCLLLAVDHQNKWTKSLNHPFKTVWTINQ